MIYVYVWNAGFHGIMKITRKKERHTWALQVMAELLERTSLYKYNEGGIGNAKDEKSDIINFDPRLTGAPEGVEADKFMCTEVANTGQNSPVSVTKDNQGKPWL